MKIIAAQEGIRGHRVCLTKNGSYYCARRASSRIIRITPFCPTSPPLSCRFSFFLSRYGFLRGRRCGGSRGRRSLRSLLWLAKTRPSISIRPQRNQIDRTESAARPPRAMSVKFNSRSISAFGSLAPRSFSALLPPLVEVYDRDVELLLLKNGKKQEERARQRERNMGNGPKLNVARAFHTATYR